jgi:hypothetical protein
MLLFTIPQLSLRGANNRKIVLTGADGKKLQITGEALIYIDFGPIEISTRFW